MRFPTCLPVAPIDMEATVGGSSGIPLDPSMGTRRGKEKNLKKWRLAFLWLQETEGRDWSKNKEKRRLQEVFSKD